MNDTLFTDPWQVVLPLVYRLEFTMWLVRYSIIAGLAFLLAWGVLRLWQPHRRIQRRDPRAEQMRRELGWSILTMAVFALMGTLVFSLKRAGVSAVYDTIEEYGWLYYAASWGVLLLVHDAYFYWAHRFMHWGPVYRVVHSVHHRSTNPTPLAAFAFHPLEAVIEYAILNALVMIVTLHRTILMAYPTLMLLLNVYAHLGYELLPRGFANSAIGRYLLTATLHNQHHKKFNYNYGLWFFWWDRWFGTMDPEYGQVKTEPVPAKEVAVTSKKEAVAA